MKHLLISLENLYGMKYWPNMFCQFYVNQQSFDNFGWWRVNLRWSFSNHCFVIMESTLKIVYYLDLITSIVVFTNLVYLILLQIPQHTLVRFKRSSKIFSILRTFIWKVFSKMICFLDITENLISKNYRSVSKWYQQSGKLFRIWWHLPFP